MEARARGHVDVHVRVMHHVKAPQRRDRVKHHMLQVDHQIENDHGEQDFEPGRPVQAVEQAVSKVREAADAIGEPLSVGFGCHVGEVVYGNIGTPKRLDLR